MISKKSNTNNAFSKKPEEEVFSCSFFVPQQAVGYSTKINKDFEKLVL
jgi:hypothetical protein